MRKKIVFPGPGIAFALLASISLTSLTDCGSGSTKGGAVGTTVTASFSGATMPSAVAYQAGTDGAFQTLTRSGSSVSFTLPSGITGYGFAYICPTFSAINSYSNETIIQATTTDTTSLSLACPSLSGHISATFDVSGIPGVTSTFLCERYWSNEMYGTSGIQSLSGVPTGTFDVALVAAGANGALGIQILRGVNVTSSTSIAFPPMTAADELGVAPASITNVPSGTTADFDTTYQTAGGLSVSLPVHSNGAPQSTYPTVPSSQSQSADFYVIHAGANLLNQNISLSSTVSSNTASAVTLALPAPPNSLAAPVAAAFPTFNANFGSFSVQGSILNASWIQFQTPGLGHTVYNVYTFVTNSWLGANTTFTVPDLSKLTGFTPVPPSGAREFWSLYSIAGSPLQFDSLQQSVAPVLTPPISLQSISTSGAFTVP